MISSRLQRYSIKGATDKIMNNKITVDRIPPSVGRDRETAELVKWCNKLSEAFNALSEKVQKIEEGKEN